MIDNVKVIIAGSRNFDNYNLLHAHLEESVGAHANVEIVSGKAPGADTLGERYAISKGYTITEFPAPWQDIVGRPSFQIGTRYNGDKYWKGAGHFRNEQMAKYADALVAFWDGRSTGTKNMIKLAEKHKLTIKIVRYE